MKSSCCGISGASKMIGCPCKSLVMISLLIAAWMVPKDGEGCFVSSHWFPLSGQPHLVRFSNPQVSVLNVSSTGCRDLRGYKLVANPLFVLPFTSALTVDRVGLCLIHCHSFTTVLAFHNFTMVLAFNACLLNHVK